MPVGPSPSPEGSTSWFGGEFEASTTFCPRIGSDLQVFDANRDGYDDLTCHSSNNQSPSLRATLLIREDTVLVKVLLIVISRTEEPRAAVPMLLTQLMPRTAIQM